MPDSIRVPDIPGPRKQLCWKQDPATLVRCDRALHGSDVRHTWEMAAELTALRQRHDLAVLMAWHEGEKWGEAHPLSLCTDRNAAWLASSAKAALEGDHD